MLDAHDRLFEASAPYIIGIPAYTFFVGFGMLAGLLYYFIDLKRSGQVSEGAIKIVFSALFFGAIGSKIPLLLKGVDFMNKMIDANWSVYYTRV